MTAGREARCCQVSWLQAVGQRLLNQEPQGEGSLHPKPRSYNGQENAKTEARGIPPEPIDSDHGMILKR